MEFGFEKLEVWKEARILCQAINDQILSNVEIKDYPLKDQINRSTASVMDNISEGQGRGGNKEFIQFLYLSRGSISEVKSQLIRAMDREYISEKQYLELIKHCSEILRMLNGLIKYLKTSDFTGNKFSPVSSGGGTKN